MQLLCDEGLEDSKLEFVEHPQSGYGSVSSPSISCPNKAEEILARYCFPFTVTLEIANPNSRDSKLIS